MKTSITFFLWIYSLEIWWDVARHQLKPCPQVSDVSCVLIAHNLPFKNQKSAKTTINFERKLIFQLFSQSCGHSRLTLFVEKRYFHRLAFPPHDFLNKYHKFFGKVKNRFSLQKMSQWRHKYGKDTKKRVAVFRIRRYLHWLSSALRSPDMADSNFKRRDRALCRPLMGVSVHIRIIWNSSLKVL